MEQVVEQVLAAARERLAEQLTLDDLAKVAMFSKFHFARVFRRVTGVSPRRFLYALRLEEAKRLLITTQLSVAEVSHSVGYSSVGTFTSRFTASVGVSPAAYRRLRGHVLALIDGEPPDPTAPGHIAGRLEAPAGGVEEPVTVGLFAKSFPEGRPVRYEVLRRPGEWSFGHVPAGRWYVLAASAPSDGAHEPGGAGGPILMSMSEPVRVCERRPVAHVTMRLRPMRSIDPPILVALVHPRRRGAPASGTGLVTA